MNPVDGPICECVVLDGHKGKMTSNSNDPPNSFHTNDLFIAHPSIPNAWKFVGRLDDRITLTNGEKVLPLPMEGRILQHPLVRESVIFGIDRAVPGLLLFRAEAARGLSDEEFLEEVWPAIGEANEKAEGFAQIGREMVVVLGEDIECPSTDKSSIKRAQVYREFKEVIDSVYERLESSQEGALVLDGEVLEKWILKEFEKLGVLLKDSKEDFFSAGVDSLKAIQMRGLIIRNIDLGGNASKCPSMVVYDSGNTKKLAKALIDIRSGKSNRNWDAEELLEMGILIEEYSHFVKREVRDGKAPGHNVVVCFPPLKESSSSNRNFSFLLVQRDLWALISSHISSNCEVSPRSTAYYEPHQHRKQPLSDSMKPFKNDIQLTSPQRRKFIHSWPISPNQISAYQLRFFGSFRKRQHTLSTVHGRSILLSQLDRSHPSCPRCKISSTSPSHLHFHNLPNSCSAPQLVQQWQHSPCDRGQRLSSPKLRSKNW